MENILQCSQELTTGSYHEPAESTARTHIAFNLRSFGVSIALRNIPSRIWNIFLKNSSSHIYATCPPLLLTSI
jgi:hypothetical protein